MKDEEKPREQLVGELAELRQRVAGFEASEAERKQAEDALQRSERLYRGAIEAANAVPYRRSRADAYDFIGEGIRELTGYSAEEFTPGIWESIVQEEIPVGRFSGLSVADAKQKSREKGLHWQAETRIRTRSGEERWLADTSARMLDERGTVAGSLGMLLDITERKRVQEALQAREEFLDRIIDQSPFATWISDAKGTLLRANSALKRFLNLTDERLVGKYNVLRDPVVERQGLMPLIRTVYDEGKSISFTCDWDGNDIPGLDLRGSSSVSIEATMFPIHSPEGELTHVVLNWIDITERKRADEALRESEERFRSTFEQAAVGIVHTVPGGVFLLANQRFCDILGYTQDEIRTLNFREVTHPDDLDADLSYSRKLLAGEIPTFLMEKRYLRKDGSTVWVNLTVSLVREPSGDPKYFVGVVEDITEHKQMEEQIRRAHNLESLGVLAGGIAHDFNNVLTGVTGNLALLERLLDKDSEEDQIAVDARKSADRTRDLTSQLMTFARGGAPVKETASIEELTREITGLSLSGSNTKPYYQFAESLLSVDIDRGQIGQVIQNLVLNADHAMPQGGILTISAENVDVSDGDVLPLEAGRYVKVSVEDQGIGISEGLLGKIFDPYFTTKQAGHGLGLSITHSILQRHGGHIAVRSEAGAGATFDFYLPASEKQAEEAAAQEKAIVTGTGRILLMDDEEVIHRAVGRFLRHVGYEMESVYDGAEALAVYAASMEAGSPYDVVIMDLTIPGGMGGREAVRKLREMHPEARVIVSSGYANDPVMASPEVYGFNGRVGKPVGLDDLVETVQRVLGGGDAVDS